MLTSRFPARRGTDTALGIKDKDEVESFGEGRRCEVKNYRKYKGGLCVHVYSSSVDIRGEI